MSVTTSIRETKTHLWRLLAEVEAGGEVVITKAGRPVAKLVAFSPTSARQPGAWTARLDVPDEALFEPLPGAAFAGMKPGSAAHENSKLARGVPTTSAETRETVAAPP